MTQRLEKILEPGMIGPVRTRNRILKTANGTSFMEADQTVGPRMVAWYEKLAKGGAGFIVVESSGVEYPLGIHHLEYLPGGGYNAVQLHFEDDRLIPGYQRLTEAVHKHGCPVSIQLFHSGPWDPTGKLPRDPKIRDVKCASAMTQEELPGPDFAPCRAMTKQEIEDQVDIWASAAERARRAGFDACELNHATCHLGNTFLSRVWNKREDEYGPQSYENRTRFLRDIVSEAKRRCGPDFAVHVLMNAAEYNHPLAMTLEEGAELAMWVATVADGLNVRSERYGHRGGLQQPDRILYPEPPVDLPKDLDWSNKGRGATVPLVEAVKRKGVTIPVWSACRLDPVIGEEYLRKGSIDFVAMTRRILADPDLPNKVIEGRLEDIRPCTGCLHCFDCRNQNKLLECRVNATLGRELIPEYQTRPATPKKKVLVVGGGPAGAEAARVAANRGHEVVLYEKEPHLGGLLPVAAVVKDLETEELTDLTKYFEIQLKKEGVRVRLGKTVDAKVVRVEKPDVLVLAGGAAHTEFDLPGSDRRGFVKTEKLHKQLKWALRVFSAAQLERLTRLWMPMAKSAVIMGGKLHGCELAEFLVKRGRQVVVVHDGPPSELGEGMTRDDLDCLWPWLKLKHVPLWTDADYRKVVGDGLEIQVPDKRVFVLEGKAVMTTQDWGPNSALVSELEGLVDEVHVVGSCREPGWIVDAIREGAQCGYAI